MNAWRKFEEIVKPWMVVLAFLLVVLFAFHKEANAEVTVELGPTFLSGEFSGTAGLMLHEKFDNNYSVGLGIIGEQKVVDRAGTTYHPDVNLFIQGQRLVYLGNVELGVGVAYFNRTHRAIGSNFTAALSIAYEWDRWSVAFRHWSNAGSASPNMGQDLFVVGYRF